MKLSIGLIAIFMCFVWTWTDEEVKRVMLEMHNELRQRIINCNEPGVPPAAEMPLLVWNDELAQKAKTLTNKCIDGHDTLAERSIPKFWWVGQNWAGAWTLEQGFQLWLKEKDNYNHQTGQCNEVCGHYTQLVWAATTEVGCAATECSPRYFPYGSSIVCNYGLGGNLMGEMPFKLAGPESCGKRKIETICANA